jgi:hypothetical protein
VSRSAPSKSLGRLRFHPRPFDLRYSEFERLAVIFNCLLARTFRDDEWVRARSVI